MPPKNPKLKAGLAALGVIWISATTAGAQDSAPTTPPTAPVPVPANAPTFAVLLMSNGRIVQGLVSEPASGDRYVIHERGRTIDYPKRMVSRRYASFEDLYLEKVSHLPERDPDERMKLAQWCLVQGMNSEARDHLKAILAINPADSRAERMIASIETNSQRAEEGRDVAVRTTSGEMVEVVPSNPRRKIGRSLRPGPPVIFELPPDQAFKRTTEFTRNIHPILQTSCASCHGEGHKGDFQLVAGKSRREWTPEVVAANLDASLRFIDREEPLRSELLTFATTPHGSGKNSRAVFHGANDPKQRALASWLASLKASEPTNKPGTSPGFAPDATAMPIPNAEGGFGVERTGGATSQVPAGLDASPEIKPDDGIPKPRHYVENIEAEATDPRVPSTARFSAPYLQGGPQPVPPSRGIVQGPGTIPPLPTLPSGPGVPGLPGAAPGVTPLLGGLPGTPVPPPDDVLPPTSRPKKGSKVDAKLLENLLKNRQAGTPAATTSAPQP